MAIEGLWDSSHFRSLKARVKAEMTRRDGNGSMVTYAGIIYDYIDQPTQGQKPKIEHWNKVVEPINAVKNVPELSTVIVNNYVRNPVLADAVLTTLEAQPRNATSNNDCAGLCSGMCISTCTTTCTGTCVSTCADDCSSDCTGDCSGDCTGTCSGDCTGKCTAECANDCSGHCGFSCEGSCVSTCTGTCATECGGVCADSCTGCTGTATGGCDGGCQGGCESGGGSW